MKPISSPPVKVPRLNSLLHRLQKNPGPDDASYLDQLMVFLDDPPKDVTNRWVAGAEMCAAWGIKTSDTSVWRLYKSYLIEWRVRVTLKIDDAGIESTEVLAQKATQMIALRTCEMLGNPSTPIETLLSLFRMDLRHQRIELVRVKQRYQEQSRLEFAMDELKKRVAFDPYAEFALKELKLSLYGGHSQFRDKFNEPYRRARLKAMGIDPDSLPSPGPVISRKEIPKETPKTP